MKKGITFLITIILIFSLLVIGISKINKQSQSEEKIKVIATLFPQYDFAKQIGGDKVDVSLLLTPGTETHTYEPTPQDIINVNKADLYIYTGKYMEPWSDKIANSITSNTQVLDASKNINLINEEQFEKEHDTIDNNEEEYINEEDVIDDIDLLEDNLNRGEFFYLPAKALHIDSDEEYLSRCLKFYKRNGIMAVGKKINEKNVYEQLPMLLKEFKPDIVVITGHDAYYRKKGDAKDIKNYKNSLYFVKAVKAARNYEKSHEKLVIIAGACQSDYEELIKAGANFASSPKRVNIHALDPAIIASTVALTERNKEIDLKKLLEKTKYKEDGMGGLICNGLMYVGYPR